MCLAETATNGAKLPPVAPIGAGSWRHSALGGGANRRWAVAPIDTERWRQSTLLILCDTASNKAYQKALLQSHECKQPVNHEMLYEP